MSSSHNGQRWRWWTSEPADAISGANQSVGVIPDEIIGPTNLGLANKADPVLAYAATLLGTKLTSEQAGSFYLIWDKPEDVGEPETESKQ